MKRARSSVVAATAAAVLVLPACGAAERQQQTATDAGDHVDVVLRPHGPGGQQLHKTLRCTKVTPDCKRLAQADFSPPAEDLACTAQFGGPATATVTGRAGGRAIDATFDLRDGCAISRWQRFAWLLGKPPRG